MSNFFQEKVIQIENILSIASDSILPMTKHQNGSYSPFEPRSQKKFEAIIYIIDYLTEVHWFSKYFYLYGFFGLILYFFDTEMKNFIKSKHVFVYLRVVLKIFEICTQLQGGMLNYIITRNNKATIILFKRNLGKDEFTYIPRLLEVFIKQ